MRIEVDKLEEHGNKFLHVYQVNELPLDATEIRLVEPCEVSGRVRRHGTEVELRGKLNARLEVFCGRCLKPVEFPVTAEFTQRFVRAVDWSNEEQHELLEEDLDLAVFDGEAIELDELVREELLLALPANVLCHPDCKGLCPICGVDLNVSECQCETNEVDSRWRQLKDLQM